jgi:hypothetical protein
MKEYQARKRKGRTIWSLGEDVRSENRETGKVRE